MPLQEISLGDQSQLQSIADRLAKSRRIIIISGAGISTSCGIPDFRSKDGLYKMIPEQNLPPTPPPSNPATPSRKRKRSHTPEEELPSSQSSNCSTTSSRSSSSSITKIKGQDLFNSRVFQSAESTSVFYRFIAALRQKITNEVNDTSLTHKFIRTLRDGGRLVRCYTQNIDGLERREGLCMSLSRGMGNKRRFMKKYYNAHKPDYTEGTDFDAGCEIVQLHGDLDRLRCTVCSCRYEWTDEENEIFEEGAAPTCQNCEAKSERRQSTGKRGLSVGTLRPNVVLYGEDHPFNSLLTPFIPYDVNSQPEVLLIMGTSLKVFGLQKIIREFSKAVHAGEGKVIIVNRTRPAESVWDGIIDDFVAMDCDAWVEDLKIRRPDIWLRQGEVGLRVTKPGLKRKRVATNSEDETSLPLPPKRKYTKKQNTSKATDLSHPTALQSNQNQTPRHHARSTTWKSPYIPEYHFHASNPTRPNASPLINSFKPLPTTTYLPGSPWTPQFSPMTPRVLQSKTTIYPDSPQPQTPTNNMQMHDINKLIELSRSSYENPCPSPQENDDDNMIVVQPTEMTNTTAASQDQDQDQVDDDNNNTISVNVSYSFVSRFQDKLSKAIGTHAVLGKENQNNNGDRNGEIGDMIEVGI